ncbi:MAG: hypothetical protein AB8B83_04380 [Bdellovibrionales bacterium]
MLNKLIVFAKNNSKFNFIDIIFILCFLSIIIIEGKIMQVSEVLSKPYIALPATLVLCAGIIYANGPDATTFEMGDSIATGNVKFSDNVRPGGDLCDTFINAGNNRQVLANMSRVDNGHGDVTYETVHIVKDAGYLFSDFYSCSFAPEDLSAPPNQQELNDACQLFKNDNPEEIQGYFTRLAEQGVENMPYVTSVELNGELISCSFYNPEAAPEGFR